MLLFGCFLLGASFPDIELPPQRIEPVSDKSFTVTADTPVVLPDNAPEQMRMHLSALFEPMGMSLPVREATGHKPGDPGIYVGVYGEHPAFERRKVRRLLMELPKPGPQGYVIRVAEERIVLAGGDSAGVYYGLLTLGQMVQSQLSVPTVKVVDSPDLPIRGVLLTTRPQPAMMQRLADLRCNLVMVEHEDLYALGDSVRPYWQSLFDGARHYHMEPVPVLNLEEFSFQRTPEEARQAVRNAVARLDGTLSPAYVQVNLGASSSTWNPGGAGGLGEALRAIADVVSGVNPEIRLMVRVDARDLLELRRGTPDLPEGLVLIASGRHSGVSVSESFTALESSGVPVLASASPDKPAVYAKVEAAHGAEALGAMVEAGPGDEARWPAVELLATKGWSLDSTTLAWPEGFNHYFDASLWEPDLSAMLPAMIEHLNRRTLRGVSPAEEGAAFTRLLTGLRQAMPESQIETHFVESVYRSILNYVELEAEYHDSPQDFEPEKLVELVRLQERLHGNWPEGRAAQIVKNVREQGLFVPSTILFNQYVCPFRHVSLPSSSQPLPYAGSPNYEDKPQQSAATFSFHTAMAPVFRIDFESFAVPEIRVEQGKEPGVFRNVDTWAADAPSGVRGPLMLLPPIEAPYLRLTAASPDGRGVLRNVRLFGLKEPTAVICRTVQQAPTVDGQIQPGEWDGAEPIHGFVQTSNPAFAELQTSVRIMHGQRRIYVAARAIETRLDTMVVRQSGRDGALWLDESIELRIQPGTGHRYRFIVNPKGGVFDSRNGDPDWNENWTAQTGREKHGWVVEWSLPFSMFEASGEAPSRGDSWEVNIVRNRRNVVDEQSTWVADPSGRGDADGWGVAAFN